MSKYHITFGDLINELNQYHLIEQSSQNFEAISIDHISYNSKEIKPNTLFICKGLFFKPEYLQMAAENGAVCYLSENYYDQVDHNLPHIIVNDIRKAMSITAAFFYNYVYKDLHLIGLTGTKGKTTTTYFIKNILDSFLNEKSAVLSTVEVYTGGISMEAHLTTPEPPDLHYYFADAKEHDMKYLTMEVSSQAYKMSRVYGMEFDTGLFLNIGEDHIGPLEHTDFEDYLNCKLEFIRHCKTVIINKNTDYFERVLDAAKNAEKTVTFGTDSSADFYVTDVKKLQEGFEFTVNAKNYTHTFTTNMHGRFNIENALAAITVAKTIGVDDQSIQNGIKRISVQGRMNVFEKNGLTVIVDYAHNHLSFAKLYESLKVDYAGRRIVTVFGCPGGKAYIRRRDIGTLSGQNADYIYLTAEDPQFEDVREICEDIAEYIKPYNTPYEIIEDRTEAIEKAIFHAQPNDVIIVAGKGEEVYQKVRGEYIAFESDYLIVKRCLKID